MGLGDTPETEGDYALADSVHTNYKLSFVGGGRNATGVGDLCSVYSSFRNNGSEPVVVKEVGLMGNPTTDSSQYKTALFFRKVLDTPITIQPGETYMFLYNVRFKH